MFLCHLLLLLSFHIIYLVQLIVCSVNWFYKKLTDTILVECFDGDVDVSNEGFILLSPDILDVLIDQQLI